MEPSAEDEEDEEERTEFTWSTKASISCMTCKALLFVGKKVEDGHRWNGMAAAVFSTCGTGDTVTVDDRSEDVLAEVGVPFEIRMIQGVGKVATVRCGACNTEVGWKFVSSPIVSQTGKIGLMLPQVTLDRLQQGELLLLPALTDGADALDILAWRFMRHHGILGMSATWALAGREPLARSWGFSAGVGGVSPSALTPETRLRVASVSKPLTAVAVMQLVEAGRLGLDDAVLPLLGLVGGSGDVDQRVRDARAAAITVRHLLHHICGGWTNKGGNGCPMFKHWGMSRQELIETTLRERALEYDPGFQYGYSNFGYCLLGRVVEVVSGAPTFEAYVREHVLARCGIEGAYVEDGRNAATLRYFMSDEDGSGCEDRVERRFALTDSPLTDSLVGRMDSHGGWVLSPSELVRFSQALDTPGLLLNEESLQQLQTPLDMSKGYAMGWCTNTHARWHNGSLAGTGSILVHTKKRGGMHWALVTNTGQAGGPVPRALDRLGWECLDAVEAAL